MDKLLRDAAQTLTLVVRNSAGVEVAADTPPLVVVKDSAGATIVASTASALRAGTTGTYDVPLLAVSVAILDVYTATWTVVLGAKTSTFKSLYEVTGGFLFTISELRAYDKNIGDDTTTYTAAKIVDARQKAEERLEELCGVAFRPRGRRAKLDGNGTREIILPDPMPIRIVSGTIDAGSGAVALTSGEVAEIALYETGRICRPAGKPWTGGSKNVSILYEHGHDEVPDPVKHAALQLARSYLVESPIDPRAISESTEAGTIRYSTAGRDGPTGIPDVDSIVAAYMREAPGIA